MSVPNQKHIAGVHKEQCDTTHIYAKINIDAIQNAMLSLKPSTVKVWFYFAKNQDGYEFDLSSVAVCSYCNISDKTYREAIKELTEKRFLVPVAKNVFEFYEVPKEFITPRNGDKIICHTSTLLVDKNT
jgi:hypothetical protein